MRGASPQDSRLRLAGRAKREGDLVHPVYLVCLVQPTNEIGQINKRDQPVLLRHAPCSMAPEKFSASCYMPISSGESAPKWLCSEIPSEDSLLLIPGSGAGVCGESSSTILQ